MKLYTVQFNAVAVTVQQDFFEINANSAKPLYVHSIELSQTTEVGDAQEENLLILIKRGATTSGLGGSAPTPVPIDPSLAASSFSAEVNNTTKASVGTIVTLYATAWNIRANPMPWVFTPESRIVVPGGGRLTVELGTTPIDSITMNGTMVIEELG